MATVEGTRRILGRAVNQGMVHAMNIRALGPLSCAALGFGAYRIGGGDKEPVHRAALRSALRAGVNLIDTSSHYSAIAGGAHGASERLIGQVVAEAMQAGDVTRDELVICTKLGHAAQGAAPPGGVLVNPNNTNIWHSIDPEFVDTEVRASRERLGTPPDFVLLHNPEYFLQDQLHKKVPIADAWGEMYEKLQLAFQKLEVLCKEGMITTGYGVSGNFLSCYFSITGRPNLYEALALDRVVDAAAAAAGTKAHRLKLVQLPLNVFENGAVLGRGGVVPEATKGDCTLADELGVAVVTNRPLNALPMPNVSSGDWNQTGASYLRLADKKPMGSTEALLKRVLLEALSEEGSSIQHSKSASLQQLALHLAMSAPSVSCSLCGTRSETYVEDATAVLRQPPLSAAQVLRAFTAIRTLAEELGCETKGLWT